MLASEKNRLHKLLTDAGIRLGVVVSDLHGHSARAMVKAIITGHSMPEILALASKRMRASREDLFEALQAEELTPGHRFVLAEIMAHIEKIESRVAHFDHRLVTGLIEAGHPTKNALKSWYREFEHHQDLPAAYVRSWQEYSDEQKQVPSE